MIKEKKVQINIEESVPNIKHDKELYVNIKTQTSKQDKSASAKQKEDTTNQLFDLKLHYDIL